MTRLSQNKYFLICLCKKDINAPDIRTNAQLWVPTTIYACRVYLPFKFKYCTSVYTF